MGEVSMRRVFVVCLITALAIGCGPGAQIVSAALDESAADVEIDSGIYGFAGAHVAEGADAGVVGECIWVFDQSDRRQIAQGSCRAGQPGRFRLALRPGKYVVHGPGGNYPIEVKRGQWTQVRSLLELPTGP
jgi:hypothetical protein